MGDKVFKRTKELKFDYPQDMKMIMRYLNKVGEVFVAPDVIEDLYYLFSEKKYDVDWLMLSQMSRSTRLCILNVFADWLEGVDL